MSLELARSVLLLAPHLDDAALSCGGLMLKLGAAGRQVTAATVFASLPGKTAATSLAHALLGAVSGNAWMWKRQAEDIRALSQIGAKVLHGCEVDAPFRRDNKGVPLYADWASIFAQAEPHERCLVARIADQVERWHELTGAEYVLAPLGFGGHVDHLIVRAAVERIASRLGEALCFYEDLPYARKAPRSLPKGVSRCEIVSIDLEAKLDLINRYPVSIRSGGAATTILRDVTASALSALGMAGAPGERYWRRS
jgi:LmbE family N-acetylglucosaminyl deacetylase